MNRLEVSLQQTIITLAQRGWSQRRIARELAVDRETVKRYAPPAKPASNPTAGSEGPKPATNPTAGFSPGPPSRCEPHREAIAAALERGLTAQRIHQDLCAEHGFAGSYESVKRFVRRMSPLTLTLMARRPTSR
jgi:transposase